MARIGIFAQMPNPRSRLFTYISAGSLAALTLATFYILRNYGPEKAVWRFHHAALTKDQLEIARVTMQPPNTDSVQFLEAFLRAANRASEPQVIAYRQTSAEAYFSIAYQLPRSPVPKLVVNWVVEDTESVGWVIDATKTIEASPDLGFFGNPAISPAPVGHFFSQTSVLG